MTPTSDLRCPTIGAWLPADWYRPLTADEKRRVERSDIDLLLIPENHDAWANRDAWKEAANEMETAIYAGFEDDGWTLGLFFDPESGTEKVYTKHSTSENIALERDDWAPADYLHTLEVEGVPVGTTICHDHYLSPFMRYEGLNDASVLLNLSASPVVRRKWGEVLQARAIENSAYVVCTMHGLEPDGSESKTNKGHVFAFDPFGDQIALTELGSERELFPFSTEPDNIYKFEVNPALATYAGQTLSKQNSRPSIERVRENEFGSAKPTKTTLNARLTDSGIELSYSGKMATLDIDGLDTVQLGRETFVLLSIDGDAIFHPEQLYESLLDVEGIEDRRILIHNHWDQLTESYLNNVVEPVLRARCVEWCSPVLVTSDSNERAYQLANKHKDTHEIPRDDDGWFNFEVKRAFGINSALKPVDGRDKQMRTLARACISH